ncbi:hypothetical protein SGLAM104S_08086 [Streptomyces glaucescens]
MGSCSGPNGPELEYAHLNDPLRKPGRTLLWIEDTASQLTDGLRRRQGGS